MQTFLPYPDFARSLRCLDWRRLGKQRLEAVQLLRILRGLPSPKTGEPYRGYLSHPAKRMWEGHDDALAAYLNECIAEWVRRGYRNTMPKAPVAQGYGLPTWMGDERVHSSHRANLLRKDFAYYSEFGWAEEPMDGYFWPCGSNTKPPVRVFTAT